MPSPPHTENVNSSHVQNSQIHQYNENNNNINRDLEENGEEKDVENNEDTDVIDVDDDDEDDEEDDDGDDDEEDEEEDDEDEDEDDDDEDENMSQLSSGGEEECDNKDEFVLVRLSDIRKEVQCPICLGIIRKTRTVMECLHRFCRECIDKSMRLGNNECPACRTHCASRRSLRDDPNYDALIAAIYPDIDQYEEEELSYQEDEKARNMQIQAAIAQTFRRQTEALSKKRKRSHVTYRRRRAYKSEDEEEANAHDAGNSSQDERSTEVKSRRPKRWKGHSSAAGASGDGGVNEHDQEVNKEATVTPVGWVGSSEMLAWGKGGLRSNTRHGSGAGGNGKHSRSRLAKLSDHLRNLKENESEMEIQVVLICLDQQKPSSLHHSFLSSRPALSVGQLCQYISLQTSLPPDRVEILAAKVPFSTIQGQVSSSCALQACNNDLQVLDTEETLGGLRATTNFSQGHLTLAYRQKVST